MRQHLKSNFHSVACQVVAYGRLKIKENFKLLGLKVVVVASYSLILRIYFFFLILFIYGWDSTQLKLVSNLILY